MALHPKAITFLSIVLGLAVIAVLAFLFRGWFVEEWHLWQLQSESEEVRKDAATALVALGSTKAVPALFEAWERDIRTKEQSGKPYRIGLPTTEVVKSWGKELMGFWRLASGFHNDGNAFYIHYESFDFHYCMKALSTIVQGSVDEALPFVIDKTEPGNPYSQWLAIILLVEFASDRESTATAVAAQATNNGNDLHVRQLATCALTLLDLEPEEIAPALRRVLEDQDKDDRLQRFAARHFAKLGRAGVETLLEAFRSGGARTRAFAIGGLSQVAQKTDEIVATFVSALDDEAAKVRSEGVSGLRRVAESDGSTIPQLVKALDHKEENVRRGAASAFGAHKTRLAASDGIPSLIRLLGDDVIEVRQTAAYALGRIGPPGKDAIPALIDRLDDPNAEVRMYVAAALARVDTSGRTLDRAFPLLLEALKAPQEWAAKYEAKLALVSLQSVESAEMATRVVAALEGLLEDDDSYIRNHAEQSLEKLRRSLKPETRLTPR